jgi:HSP20 family protein
MVTDTRRLAADVCSYVSEDGSKLNMEILLPGVKKEDIKLRLLDDTYTLSAPRNDIEYVATGGFCCPIKPTAANATYDNGLLKIEVPFKDVMESAVNVTIH